MSLENETKRVADALEQLVKYFLHTPHISGTAERTPLTIDCETRSVSKTVEQIHSPESDTKAKVILADLTATLDDLEIGLLFVLLGNSGYKTQYTEAELAAAIEIFESNSIGNVSTLAAELVEAFNAAPDSLKLLPAAKLQIADKVTEFYADLPDTAARAAFVEQLRMTKYDARDKAKPKKPTVKKDKAPAQDPVKEPEKDLTGGTYTGKDYAAIRKAGTPTFLKYASEQRDKTASLLGTFNVARYSELKDEQVEDFLDQLQGL